MVCVYSLHFILSALFDLFYSSSTLPPVGQPVQDPPPRLTILRCCWKFNPHAVRNEALLLSLLLLQLWSGPNVIRQWPWHDWPGNLKKELRGGRVGGWSVLIWPVNPEKKGIILKVSFLSCCSALWVIKVSCIRFSLANIAIYNDLTFLF